jgi:hypothetical protein
MRSQDDGATTRWARPGSAADLAWRAETAFALMRQGVKLATLAPGAVAAAVFDRVLMGLMRRVGRRMGRRGAI